MGIIKIYHPGTTITWNHGSKVIIKQSSTSQETITMSSNYHHWINNINWTEGLHHQVQGLQSHHQGLHHHGLHQHQQTHHQGHQRITIAISIKGPSSGAPTWPWPSWLQSSSRLYHTVTTARVTHHHYQQGFQHLLLASRTIHNLVLASMTIYSQHYRCLFFWNIKSCRHRQA